MSVLSEQVYFTPVYKHLRVVPYSSINIRKGKLRNMVQKDPVANIRTEAVKYFFGCDATDLANPDGWRKFLLNFINPIPNLNVDLNYRKYHPQVPADLVLTVWKWGARKKHTKVYIFEMRISCLTELGEVILKNVTDGKIITFEL